MTLEHKILHLVDRTPVSSEQLCELFGQGDRLASILRRSGLLEWYTEPYMKLTPLGRDRLDELDGYPTL